MNAVSLASTEEPEVVAARSRYAERINAEWRRSRDSWLTIGDALTEAKARLPRGQFLEMLWRELEFHPRMAQRFMELARNRKLVNATHVSSLPKSARAFLAFTKLSDSERDQGIKSGKIHPDASEPEVLELHIVREPKESTPRAPETLVEPIRSHHELLATLKGYRASQGLSQLDLDYKTGWQEGYAGKVELDLRSAITIHESFWLWLGALKLDLVLVPSGR